MSSRPEDHRRKWNTAEYERLHKELEAESKKQKDDQPVKKELLKARDYKVDLESKLGKSVVISKTASTANIGYYCNVCDCAVKDSMNFLDHINGKKHITNMGMSMKIKRSTVDEVKERLELNKKKKTEDKKSYDLEERIKEIKEEEEKAKEYRKEKKKKRKLEEDEEAEKGGDPEADDMAAMMGFAGFGSSSKKK